MQQLITLMEAADPALAPLMKLAGLVLVPLIVNWMRIHADEKQQRLAYDIAKASAKGIVLFEDATETTMDNAAEDIFAQLEEQLGRSLLPGTKKKRGAIAVSAYTTQRRKTGAL